MSALRGWNRDDEGQWWYYRSSDRQRGAPYTCDQCGEEFPRRVQSGQLFCSRRCANKYRTTGKDPRTPGKWFWKQDEHGEWWYYRGKYGRSRGEERQCPDCGEMFRTVPSSKQVYCSQRCSKRNASHAEWREVGGWWWYYMRGGHRLRGELRTCEECRKKYPCLPMRGASAGRFCSRNCAGVALSVLNKSGPDSVNWKGGRIVHASGYAMVWKPDHHSLKNSTRKYVHEHRLVMEEKIGRRLKKYERVHHLNGKRDDNRPENLELWAGGHPAGQRKKEGRPHCSSCTCFQ